MIEILKMSRGVIFTLMFAGVASVCLADSDQNDALAPTSDPSTALTSPLKLITVSTNSLEESRLFYETGMGMTFEGPLELSKQQRQSLVEQWALPKDADWQAYRFYRPDADDIAQIQLLVFEQNFPAINNSWSALELGTFSMGFPNQDQISHEKKIKRLGFGALNELEIYKVPRPDGSLYEIEETIYTAPDFVHAVGIHRGNGMAQVGAVDKNGVGGPAYSALIVEDAQKMIDFMQDVLGWELRSDRQWKSAGTKGALNVPDGTEFRFSILYSQGARSGHALVVEYLNVDTVDNGVPPRLPNRGIGMWSVATKDLARVIKNAEQNKQSILSAAKPINHPVFGSVRAAILQAPNGLMIEVYQSLD